MKKREFVVVFVFLIIGLVGFVSAIPNPSVVYCENMNYTYNGSHCIFDSNNSCEAWDFFNGSCGAGYVIDLPCADVGSAPSPGYECCEGLVVIGIGIYNYSTGQCDFQVGGWGTCASCGDGTCEGIENYCNCPKDCEEDGNECEGLSENECSSNANCEGKYNECSGRNCANGLRYQNCQKIRTQVGNNAGQGNQGLGQVIRNRVQAGVYTSENGEQFRVRELAHNRLLLQVGGSNVTCLDCNITQETLNGKTKLKVMLKNGRDAEIKIMPDRASEKALQRLRMRVCSEENNCVIELKEVGDKLTYEMQAERHSKLFGLFEKKMQVKAQIDAESEELVRVKKPWWAFLASEPEE